MMDTLNGRTAVITGAASGLGLAMAERMAAEGMRLVLADIEADPLDDLGVQLGDNGTDVVTQRTDVSQAGDIDTARRPRLRAVRSRPRPVQQRRRRQARPVVGADGRRLALGARRRSVERHPRRAGVRPANAGASRRVGTSSTRPRCPACCRSPTWPPTASPRRPSSPCRRRCSSTSMPRVPSIGVSVLCPGFIATRITESERNRPAERTESAAVPAVARTTAGVAADHGRRRGRRPGRRRDQDEPLLDPDPQGLPIGDPATRCRRRDGRPPDGATDLVTAVGRSPSGPREPSTRRGPSGRSRRSGTARS